MRPKDQRNGPVWGRFRAGENRGELDAGERRIRVTFLRSVDKASRERPGLVDDLVRALDDRFQRFGFRIELGDDDSWSQRGRAFCSDDGAVTDEPDVEMRSVVDDGNVASDDVDDDGMRSVDHRRAEDDFGRRDEAVLGKSSINATESINP